MAQGLKRRVYQVLEVAHPDDRLSHIIDRSLIVLIVANVVAVVIETVEPIHEIADPAAFENCPTCVQVGADREANAGSVPRQFSQGIRASRSPLELGNVFRRLDFGFETRVVGLDKPHTSTGEKAGLLPFRPNQAPKRRLV